MKPTVKITLLVAATILVAGIAAWLGGLTQRSQEQAETTPGKNANSVPPPANPIAPVAPAVDPAAPVPPPPSIQPIVAPAASFAQRVKSIRALPGELTVSEIQAFYGYLLAPAASGGEKRSNENWLRNEMMDKLAEQPALPPGLVKVLVDIYQDPKQDDVIRDYALQHMTPVYAQASEEEKATLQQTLWSAVAESQSSIAGTALLALRDLAQDHPEFERARLGEAVLKLVGDDRCGELSRITALQICGRLGINQAEPLILQLARQGGNIPLQIAAIAALGDVGNEEARNYLRQLADQTEPRLKPALESALKKLNKRRGI